MVPLSHRTCQKRDMLKSSGNIAEVTSPKVALLGHGAMSELSPLCAAKQTWAQAGKTAQEKTPPALDGVQFGRATRDHIRAARYIMHDSGCIGLLSARPSTQIPGQAGIVEAKKPRIAQAVQMSWNAVASQPTNKPRRRSAGDLGKRLQTARLA
jgi:hypothetical protein